MKTHWLIRTGFLTPLFFWITILICGFLMPDYDHAARMVSELGELGSRTQYLFTIGLVLTSISSIFFNIGLYKICKRTGLNAIPVLILWVFSFSILGAGLFPFPLERHGLLGSPSIVLFLSPLSASVFWKSKIISNINSIAFFAFIIMSLGFLVFFPNILGEYFGLKQRLFHLGWTIWYLYLTIAFINA